MILLSNSLKQFRHQAKEYLAKKCVKDLDFSGNTYQVLVEDPFTNKKEWVFLQLDAQGQLKDSFCSCLQSEEQLACVHQAAAFLFVYNDHPYPLGQRFEKSLWNQLCFLCAKTLGTDEKQIKRLSPGSYKIGKGPLHFTIEALQRDSQAAINLQKMFFEREKETEETSLKFSNLTEQEIALWQKGYPSERLTYELSYWYDMARWLIWMQEEKLPYGITFTYRGNKLPKEIMAVFPEIKVSWPLAPDWLPVIIPALRTVDSPLPLYTAAKGDIEKIEFDVEHSKFIIFPKNKPTKTSQHASVIDLGDWLFVPEEGFYSKMPSFLKVADWENVENVLNEHAQELKEFLVGSSLHQAPAILSYSLSFDREWNLHIQGYLYSPGDLLEAKSYGNWIYLKNKGFYRIAKKYFDECDFVVSEHDVGNFITKHRIWLNSQEGFRTFVKPVEANLAYTVREDHYLVFMRRDDTREANRESKDFGRWIYLKGQGFFSKISLETHLPVRPDAAIAPFQIPQFIRNNRQELVLVNHFFTQKNPVAKTGLSVSQDKESHHIIVSPQYELFPEFKDHGVAFFEEFAYVPQEGFFELPAAMRLPERFRAAVVISEEEMDHFFNRDLPSLMPLILTIDHGLRRPSQSLLTALEIEQSENQQDYGLKLEYQTELGTLSVASLWWALHKNEKYLFSDAGLIDLSDSRFDWIRSLPKPKIDRRTNKLNLSSIEILKLNALDKINVTDSTETIQKHSRELLKKLTEFENAEEPDITGLKSHLRPYQKMGVHWLYFLYLHSLSGMLCDEMGLGKTHQAMALLTAVDNLYRKRQEDSLKRHFLIVCPTSVIYHWQEKLAEFLPGMRVWTFYGTKRSLDRFYNESDILLTSYGIWRNEVKSLSSFNFEVAIFDELQIAKNQSSLIYKALLKSKARMRLGLTGTPIQNQLKELKALFDIVLPSFMPSEPYFREFFMRPIEKEGNQDRKQQLSKLIKPFILRRKKADVLLDLPEKIEEISHCDLLPEQQQIYTTVLANSREKILEELENEQASVPYIHIFALLSHLKQICNHPAAFFKKPQEYKNYQSGKWELFLELLKEARESGQKVVVFTQYLGMLDIIEDYLKEHRIGYASIRGATTKRGEQLRRFNSDPKCEVFAASLQAAGLGVDLTAASVVIHYDRWWNAARENQATDRVHRIGQTRGVQVFKLVTKGTLEEHIDFLINKKSKLMEDVLGYDDHAILKRFNRSDMVHLLQTLAEPFN